MNTLALLDMVKNYVMKNLSAADVAHVETDDLEQEIYAIALELLQRDSVESLDALNATVLTRIRKKLGVREDEAVELKFDDLGHMCCPERYYNRLREQMHVRDTVDDLLETVLDPTEEVFVRLYYGIPTAEMCDQLDVRPVHYSVMDIICIMKLNDSRDTRRRVNDTINGSLRKLRPNVMAFGLLH
ncbi:MAG: hypothetical protein NC489_08670 [Ruminococcus flavefaciens]|nr:hypothetical protein [Ruminococcus flavefaciens]